MKKISLFKIILFSLFGIILRITFFYSKYKDYMKSLLIFDQSSYNFDNLKENYIYNMFHKISSIETKDNGFSKDTVLKPINDNNYYSEYEFISKPLALLYKHIKQCPEEYIFTFFIICDLIIAYLISTFKYRYSSSHTKDDKKEEKENDNKNIENNINLGVFCFYLCNPVSITTCISFNLDVVFTLINLLIPYFEDNILLCPIFIITSVIISPGYIFITIIYFVFLLSCNFRKYLKNIIISMFLLILYFKFGKILEYLPFESMQNLYYNYYWFKDIRPNFGLLWVLVPSTFLKYQNYTLIMFLVYQLTLSIGVMLSVNRIQNKDYNYKKSLVYILIFYISHILDRYPCENHLVVILCILLQHYEIIKVKIFDLGVYCAFASYALIVCRGFPYTHRRSGSSNYLFYQNLTYAVSQIMIVMFSLKGIDNFRNKCKKKDNKENEKVKEIKKDESENKEEKNIIEEENKNNNENEEEKLKKLEDMKENEMKKKKEDKKKKEKKKKKD